MIRINEKTPNGAEYSEIYYFDEKMNEVDKSEAKRIVIRECSADGRVVRETVGYTRK